MLDSDRIDGIETESAGGVQLADENEKESTGIDQLGSRELLDAERDASPADELGSYADMFAEYLTAQRHWIGPAQQPLVFHIRKLCRRLDTDDDAPASYASAYLQAISRLDKQRPGNKQPAGSDGDLPGQGSIFDELD